MEFQVSLTVPLEGLKQPLWLKLAMSFSEYLYEIHESTHIVFRKLLRLCVKPCLMLKDVFRLLTTLTISLNYKNLKDEVRAT